MKTYFKVCLLSPLWFPLLLWFLYALNGAVFRNSFEYDLGGWLIIPAISIIYGGLQYIIALWVVWIRIDFSSVVSWVHGCLLLPLVFTPIQLLFMMMYGSSSGGAGELAGYIAYFGLIDLLLGYAYVLVWIIGWAVIVFVSGNLRKVIS